LSTSVPTCSDTLSQNNKGSIFQSKAFSSESITVFFQFCFREETIYSQNVLDTQTQKELINNFQLANSYK